MLAFILCGFLRAYAQVDTLRLGKDQILVLKDSVIIPDKDTLIVLGRGVKYRIKPNPYTKSEAFYQKLKHKSEKSRLSGELLQTQAIAKPRKESFETTFFSGKVMPLIRS